MKKFVCAILVAVMMAVLAVPAFAATYSDVTKSKLDTKSYEAIVYVEKYKGWKGLSKNGKLYPESYMTRQQFMKVLYNLYGKRVPANIFDVIHAEYIVTAKYVTEKCVELSKALGYKIKWNGGNTKMRKKDVARYIKIFATYNSRFAPKK